MAISPPSPAQTPASAAEGQEPITELLKRIESRIAKDVREDLDTRMRELTAGPWKSFKLWQELYRGKTTRRHYEGGMADINIPITFENVETLTAHVMASVFPTKRWLKARPKRSGEEIKANTTAAVLQYNFEQARIRKKSRHSLSQQYILTGTTIWRRGWNFQRGAQQRREIAEDGQSVITITEEITKDHFDANVVNLYAFIPADLSCETIEDQEFVIERHVSTRRWLEDRQLDYGDDGQVKNGTYFNIDKLEDSEFTATGLTPDELIAGRRGPGAQQDQQTNRGRAGHFIERAEWWGAPREEAWWPELLANPELKAQVFAAWGVDANSPWTTNAKDWVVEIAGHDTTIRCQPNPDPTNTRPYEIAKMIPLEGEFYGMGAGEVCESLHLEANAKANQALDEKTKALSGGVAVQSSGLDHQRMGGRWETALKWRPNMVVWTKRPVQDVIQSLQNVPNSSFMGEQEVDIITQRGRNAVAANDVMMGLDQGNTATESMGMQRISMTRLGLYGQGFEDMIVDELSPKAAATIAILGDADLVVEVAGEDGIFAPKVVNPADIITEVDFSIEGARYQMERTIDRQQWNAASQNLFADPMLPMEARMEAHRETLRRFDIDNPERFLPDPMNALLYDTDPMEENAALIAGAMPKIKMDDDHVKHILAHEEVINEMLAQGVSAERLETAQRHLSHHWKILNKIIEKILQAQQGMMMQQQMASQGTPPSADAPAKESDQTRSMAQGNQLNPNEGT